MRAPDQVTGRHVTRSPAPTLDYRPALDGLRAVAVLAVMAEHAGLRAPGSTQPLLPGGFLGVDVFFVISGFLITSLLLVEHHRSGGVDLRAFWLRRARRLLPAVALMVAGTAVLVAAADLPLDAASARGDAFAALGYVANWRFVVTDQSYFAAFGLPSPFRHLWSLSVEEQWYVVFPPVLVGLCALVRRRPGALLAVLVGAALASAAWMAACHTPGEDPSRVYYGTDTRAQALLVGAALSVVMVRFPGVTRRVGALTPVMAVAGVVVLAALFHTVEGQGASLYRGGFLVVAVVSAAAVGGVALPGARGPVHWLLGRRGPVLVGRISYGLYLWHWPLFVWLTPDRVGLEGGPLLALRTAASFAVAGLSYVLVEQPVRRQGLRGLAGSLSRVGLPAVRPVVLAATAAAAVTAVVAVSTAGGGDLQTVAAATPRTTLVDPSRVTTTIVGPGHPLPAVPADRDLRVLVGGDSVAWSLVYHQVTEHTLPDGVDMRLVAGLGCTATPGLPVVAGQIREAHNCPDWRGDWQSAAFAFEPDVVVATWGAWEVFDHRDGDVVLRAGTPELAAAYQQSVADSVDATIAVAPDARFAFLTVPCMAERNAWLGESASPRNDPANLAWVNDLTAQVVARYGARATVIDLGTLLCDGGAPIEEVDGVAVREDGIHVTSEYAPVVWAYVEERIRPWLAVPAAAPAW
ncbi:MAG TPA: acyltransferase family protein [Acidimicrobiales bacterium]